MKKAQTSMEAIGAIGILLLVLLILIGLILEIKADVTKTQKIVSEKSECVKLANLITWTYINGENTFVESKIEFNSSVDTVSKLLNVEDKEEIFCRIPIMDVSQISLTKGEIKLNNENGFVKIS